MSSLPSQYDSKSAEARWTRVWEESGLTRANPLSPKEPYCIVIPPPNVTGVLHMGHALVDTLQDVLIRWKRMLGFEVLWVPGTDHAGIATQTVVERNLFKESGKRRADFTRETFLNEVWKWKERSEKTILSQLRKLGCSCDWSRLRFTMDEGCNRAVRTMFKRLFDDGLIYRGDRLVNWDPVQQTALSDDEVEHEEIASSLWHIRYPLEDGSAFLSVATTRPETLLGDVAVAVHPQDTRYTALIGRKVRLPLTDRLIPILADPFVDPAFGSGAVKITPAHDFNDFEVGRRHNLTPLNILTPDAHLNDRCGPFAGLTVEQAREKIVEKLQALHLLEKVEPHTLRIGVSYRSKATLQPYLSKQWFIRMEPFKDRLLSAVKEHRVRLIPPHWEATYLHWIENLRDWCISRQIWWGHRIPIWYKGDQILCWDGEGLPPEVMQSPSEWVQDPDVLDTWFSSALWPFSTLGWPDKTSELSRFYPNATLITGHDILFFWVARMILMGEYALGKPPFPESFLHGLIYGKSYWREQSDGSISYLSADEKKPLDLGAPLPKGVESKWEKMSKSKGNVIDPLEIIDEYGADALRFALTASATQARQIDLDRRRFEEYKNFANKIWNGSRFVLMNLEGFTLSDPIDLASLPLEDRWLLNILNATATDLNAHLSAYAFDKAASRAYEAYWNDFCATYVELAKPTLFGKRGTPQEKKQKQQLLLIALLHFLRLLHPIAPFITEEIFALLKEQVSIQASSFDPYTRIAVDALQKPALLIAPYPTPLDPVDPSAEKEFAQMLALVHGVRNIRAELSVPPSEKTDLYLQGEDLPFAKRHLPILMALTPTREVHFTPPPAAPGASRIVGTLSLFLPLPASLLEKERLRLEKERLKLEKSIESASRQLANEDFLAKAPPHLVQQLRDQLSTSERQIADIHSKLKGM